MASIYPFKKAEDIPYWIKKENKGKSPGRHFEPCPLCNENGIFSVGIFYIDAIDHLIECVPKYISTTQKAQFLDIFLYIIGFKKELDSKVDKKSSANIIHVRDIYIAIYTELDGKQWHDELQNYPNEIMIENIELLILNSLEINKLNIQFFPISS